MNLSFFSEFLAQVDLLKLDVNEYCTGTNPTIKGSNKYELPRNINTDMKAIMSILHDHHRLLARTCGLFSTYVLSTQNQV